VITYGDHEIITPDTSKFRKTLRASAPGEEDPVARAEAALAEIAGEFKSWMDEECERLDRARHRIHDGGMSKPNRQELFLAAHDVKGDSGTFGFSLVARAADSLCRLLEHTPDPGKIPLTIIDQHVDAVRAIVREYGRDDIDQVAATLTQRLRQVTDEFLISVNKHRPDYLKVVIAPSLVPGDF
jgi:chemotaxis protein histidine kinase CheA